MHKLRAADTALRHRLQQALAVKEQVVDSVLAVCPTLASEQQLVTENLALLHSLAATAQQVRRLVLATPQLLATPLQSWQQFLSAYGLEDAQIWRLLVSQPQLLLQGSIFGAGRAILFLKQLGWSDLEVSRLVIQHPQHASILLMNVEHQLQPVYQYLTQQQGMSAPAAAAFLRSAPAVLYSRDYETQVQQLLLQQRMQQLALV